MKDEKHVSIIIPNWNGEDLLEKNLPKVLRAYENKKNSIAEIIIVDDGSSDDSVVFLKRNYAGRVKVVVHKINRGFSSAINTGVRTATSGLVCLLNSDVIPEKDFLERVLPHFEDERVFAVSLHEEGYGSAKGKFVDGFIGHEGLPAGEETVESFWANGGSGVFRRSIWMELKGMDEVLLSPFYWEDIDLSYRAHKRGYKVLWEPNAYVSHEHESSIKKLSPAFVARIRERNQLLFIWKNLTSRRLFRKHINGLFNRIIKHPGYVRILFMALSKFGMVRKLRAKEKREAKISDEAIFAMFERV